MSYIAVDNLQILSACLRVHISFSSHPLPRVCPLFYQRKELPADRNHDWSPRFCPSSVVHILGTVVLSDEPRAPLCPWQTVTWHLGRSCQHPASLSNTPHSRASWDLTSLIKPVKSCSEGTRGCVYQMQTNRLESHRHCEALLAFPGIHRSEE